MKNLVKSLGFIAIMAIIGLTFLTCSEPDGNVLSGTVNIEGIAQVGQNLTANTTNLGGSGIITFQWMRGGNTVIGTNNSTYLIQSSDVGSRISITVTRSDNSGSVTSVSTAVVVFINAQSPTISTQPVNSTVSFNSSHSLSVTANTTDGGTLSYQWYSNNSPTNSGGTLITDATSVSYNPSTSTAGTFYYFAQISNTIIDNKDGGNKTSSIRSNVITLIVLPQVKAQTPNLTSQPVGATITIYATHNFNVTANVIDGGIISYQWYSNNNPSNENGTLITGATSVNFSPSSDLIGTFYYFVEVINTIPDNGDGGIKTVSIRSNTVSLVVNNWVNAQIPTIVTQPQNVTVTVSNWQQITMSVYAEVTDNWTLSYQWFENSSASNNGGTSIMGATTRMYYPPNDIAGLFFYYVEITNTIWDNGDGGNKTATIKSNAVTLTVNERVNAQIPTITSQPVGATVPVNTSHSLSVSANATDGGTLSYEWYRNTTESNAGGTRLWVNNQAYNPPTYSGGTFYYYVEITNTIPNNYDGGIKTATVRSEAIALTVINAGINLDETFVKLYLNNDLLANGRTTKISQEVAFFNINIAAGTYTDILWYVNGSLIAQGASIRSISLSKQILGLYQVIVEATPAGGVKISGNHNFIIE